MEFLSTLSLRRATVSNRSVPSSWRHFYPRSPCGERHRHNTQDATPVRISIHALLAESDPHIAACGLCDLNFYPRSPCGERQCARGPLRAGGPFLSTLSLRRATCRFLRFYSPKLYFYPRSPCGERHGRKVYPYNHATISIHALLAESDRPKQTQQSSQTHFYPRSPCGERHGGAGCVHIGHAISIHALLAESDRQRVTEQLSVRYFYPRSPCGERLSARCAAPCAQSFLSTLSLRRATTDTIRKTQRPYVFLSTLSLRRATTAYEPAVPHCCISIHALLAESDADVVSVQHGRQNFYPRSPCGERRPPRSPSASMMALFLSTLSLRRATAKVHKTVGHFCAYETNFMEIASSC